MKTIERKQIDPIMIARDFENMMRADDSDEHTSTDPAMIATEGEHNKQQNLNHKQINK